MRAREAIDIITIDQARRILFQWGHAQQIVENLYEMLASTRSLLDMCYTLPHPGALDGLPRGTIGSDPTSQPLLQLETQAAHIAEYEQKIENTTRIKIRIDQILSTFQPLTQQIISLRYAHDLPWNLVASHANCSVSAAKDHERIVIDAMREVVGIDPETRPVELPL